MLPAFIPQGNETNVNEDLATYDQVRDKGLVLRDQGGKGHIANTYTQLASYSTP